MFQQHVLTLYNIIVVVRVTFVTPVTPGDVTVLPGKPRVVNEGSLISPGTNIDV